MSESSLADSVLLCRHTSSLWDWIIIVRFNVSGVDFAATCEIQSSVSAPSDTTNDGTNVNVSLAAASSADP